MDQLFKKVGEKIHERIHDRISDLVGGDKEEHSHTHDSTCHEAHSEAHTSNRYQSFAPQSSGGAKWYVDGASYFWAVSEALERARESIYILDWWLSPELYLRRPPSANEQYRLDRMLKAAAERGVKVHIIVYKEVTQALTLNSAHTRHALEALHPNIGVFRHPDHAPADYDMRNDFQKLSLNNFDIAKASDRALKNVFGSLDDIVLFWAHHEKLLVIDQTIAFMGGLDMCFGRYDTSTHPIADAHPGNLDAIIFPGQDFNNARVFDFADVDKWEQNKLDRTKNSRMGWSDISICLNGPIVHNLVDHFVDRWNFIFGEKYKAKDPGKYALLSVGPAMSSSRPEEESRPEESSEGGSSYDFLGGIGRQLGTHLGRGMHMFDPEQRERGGPSHHNSSGEANIQLTRSCSKWSSGHETEHSIANAYISAISEARHFIYIENQFFITATSDEQRPVVNRIGGAIVDRILRAYNAGEDFKIIVIMPAVPAFAGDLKSDGALGTRAIMEFQYNSISRGGSSIIECLQKAGIDDWARYISFYNLRNYDRINTSSTMRRAERDAGVSYEDARREHDDYYGSGYYPEGERTYGDRGDTRNYDRYQEAASRVSDRTADTVSACYMDNGPRIEDIPWEGSREDEMNAYVSEELYVHSKVLIADDKLVICGSANLNDRSQLGYHDSEIAVVIEDPTPVESRMNGRPYRASKFAASLRRYLFRKHLGLLPDQRWDRPNANWTPIDRDGNDYDWGSSNDERVMDPLDRDFLRLWDDTAATNTDVFDKVFHPVPSDRVRTWEDYDSFFSKHFIIPGSEEEQKGENLGGKVYYGHVVPEEFPGGVGEVKDWLRRVRGTLVRMPLGFLADVDDIAKEGLTLNSLTDELYT